jgi:site-specific DNA recombinase
MTTAPVKAVTYCRISEDRYGNEAGVDRQRVDTDRLCEAKGWQVVERVVDNDRSASRYARKAREGWTRVLDLLAANAVDALVAYDLDRLTRRPDDLAPLIAAAERGVRIVTVTGSLLDLSTADGIFAARILLAVAEKETANTSRRAKAKLRHDAESGRPHWPVRPFGFTLKGGVVPEEAEAIRTMATWIIDGASLTEVARRMNTETTTRPTGGAAWQGQGVKDVVSKPRVAGLRDYHGQIVGPASWPAILERGTWEQVVAAISARSTGKRGGKTSLLTGMVRCGVCGFTMCRTNGTEHAELRCLKNRANPAHSGCGQSMKAHIVEQAVTEVVLHFLGTERVQAQQPNPLRVVDDVQRLTAELAELADMLARNELTMTEWKAIRGPLQARLKAAEAMAARDAVQSAALAMAGDPATIADRWQELPVDQRRRLVGLVLDHIVIGPTRNRSNRPDLGRVTMVPLV